MKKKALITSILSIVMCLCLMTGATFALFTSTSTVNIAVSSGKVEVVASVNGFEYKTLQNPNWTTAVNNYTVFDDINGFAKLDGNTLTLQGIVPGDAVKVDVKIENNSTVDVKYKAKALFYGTVGELKASVTNADGTELYLGWQDLIDGADVQNLCVIVELPEDATIQGIDAKVEIIVEAVQGNASVQEVPADTNWFEQPTAEENGTAEKPFILESEEEIAGLAKLVANGTSFSGKYIKIGDSVTSTVRNSAKTSAVRNVEANPSTEKVIDLDWSEWEPIGTASQPFMGHFDGNGYTIRNLLINKEGQNDVGFFGFTAGGSVKNLIIENAIVKGRLDVGVVAGTPYTSKYSNITVKGNVKVDGMSYVGGAFGKNVYANVDGITIDVNEGSYVNANSVENGTAYRTYVGGLAGFMGEGGHTVSNITSNIDVYGSTIDIGGIVGIAHYGNKFINITCTGNVIGYDANETEIGGIAGTWHNQNGTTVTIENANFTGSVKIVDGDTTVTDGFAYDGLVGTAYSQSGTGKLTLNGQAYQYVNNASTLKKAVEENSNIIITLADGEYKTSMSVNGGSNITIIGSENAVIDGQIASTSSTAGTVNLKGVTVKVSENIEDSTNISQTSKSAIALWGNQTVVCEGVTFNMSLADSTAITSWWDTNEGTTIIVKNCTFNCAGQRPIRANGNVTVENCTFNDPYRYAVQLTAKASTATLLDKAIINFKNNTINAGGTSSKTVVYGIQLEGDSYGCRDLVINGEGNEINLGGNVTEGAMYYCECGKVAHDTIAWNTEVAPVHAN